MEKYYQNQYTAFFTKGTKVMTSQIVAGSSREDARQLVAAEASKYGWGTKVFPSHFGRYGKSQLDHLRTAAIQ